MHLSQANAYDLQLMNYKHYKVNIIIFCRMHMLALIFLNEHLEVVKRRHKFCIMHSLFFNVCYFSNVINCIWHLIQCKRFMVLNLT